MLAAILAVAANSAIRSDDRQRAPIIVLPHSIFIDDIVVWGTWAPNAPITETITEGPVDLAEVTHGLLSGTSDPTPDQSRAEQAWSEMKKFDSGAGR